MKKLLITFFIICTAVFVNGQNSPKVPQLQRKFRDVTLLEDFDVVMQKLKQDPLIMVSRDSDFGDFDEEEKNLIKGKIPPYLRHIYYQFFRKKLFVISLFWSPKHFSHLELYRKLQKKYGKPLVFTSHTIVWEDENTKIILDSLPSIKYIDKKTFDEVKKLSGRKLFQKDTVREKMLEEI